MKMQEPISMRPAHGGVLVARRTLTIGNKVYPCGAALNPNEIPPKQLEAMIGARAARWEQKGNRVYPSPREIPPAPPAPKRPPVVIVDHVDPVQSWHLTKSSMIKACGGNGGLAADLLFADVAARDLYRRAVATATQRAAAAQRKVSVTPNEVWL
jgi:hypothetical protein